MESLKERIAAEHGDEPGSWDPASTRDRLGGQRTRGRSKYRLSVGGPDLVRPPRDTWVPAFSEIEARCDCQHCRVGIL